MQAAHLRSACYKESSESMQATYQITDCRTCNCGHTSITAVFVYALISASEAACGHQCMRLRVAISA